MIGVTEMFSQPARDYEPPDAQFATVGSVSAQGITLIFDGQTQATEKHYKCSLAATFQAGQRVKILKASGTYIVEYPIGTPGGG